jgi:hypothetical protein
MNIRTHSTMSCQMHFTKEIQQDEGGGTTPTRLWMKKMRNEENILWNGRNKSCVLTMNPYIKMTWNH